jgi:hypothetical protein
MPATGQVEYGPTTTYGTRSTLEPSFAYTTHIQILRGLSPGTLYHFRVRSTNQAGVETVSGDYTFTTTPAATPAPTLAPTPRPTATPAPPAPTGPVYTVPSSIDSTGNSDVSSALNSFVRSVPNGSTIVFRSGGSYRLELALKLLDRHDLVLDGNGATLTGYGCLMDDGPIVISDYNSAITIRNFTLRGNNADGGTSASHDGSCEHQAGISIFQSTDIVIENVTISHTNGDCLYIDYGGSARVWVDGVVFRDSVCTSNGRQGVSVIAGRNITVQRVQFDKIAMNVLDIEPNTTSGGGVNVRFLDNTVGSYSIDADWDQYLFAMSGANGTVRDITVEGNRVTGDTLRTHTSIYRSSNIVFRNNTSTVTALNDPVLDFRYVDGIVVTGNVQPLRSGAFATFMDSTNVTYLP